MLLIKYGKKRSKSDTYIFHFALIKYNCSIIKRSIHVILSHGIEHTKHLLLKSALKSKEISN